MSVLSNNSTSNKSSKIASINLHTPEIIDDFIVGDKVYIVSNPEKVGSVAFNGTTKFSDGIWIGVSLDKAFGKNNGTVQGKQYFHCPDNHGIFVRKGNLRKVSNLTKLAALSANHTVANIDDKPSELQINNNSNNNNTDNNASPNKLGAATSGHSSQLHSTNTTSPLDHQGFLIPQSPMDNSAPTTSFMSTNKCLLSLGDRVCVTGKHNQPTSKVGTLRFYGSTKFSEGNWVGIELDNPIGKNDGSVEGIRYFSCKPLYGLFALDNKVVKFDPLKHTRQHSTNFSRQGSFESVSSLASNFSSASRTRVRLGMNAVGNKGGDKSNIHGTMSSNKSRMLKSSRMKDATDNSDHAAIQKVLKEKEQHIEQLIREREIEQINFSSLSGQVDELSTKLTEERMVFDSKINELQSTNVLMGQERDILLEKLDEEKRRVEDLTFRIEEKNIDECDLENKTEESESQIFELNEKLANEKEQRDILQEKYDELLKKQHEQVLQVNVPDRRSKSTSPMKSQEEGGTEDSETVSSTMLNQLNHQIEQLELNLQKEHKLSARVPSLENELENKTAELNDVHDRFRVVKEKESQLNSTIHTMTLELNQLKSIQSDESINNLALHNDNKLLQSKNNDLTNQIEKMTQQITVISNQNADLQSRLSTALQFQVSAESQIKQLEEFQDNLEKVELERSVLMAERQSLVKEKDETMEQYLSSHEQLGNLRQQLSELMEERQGLLESKSRLEQSESNLKSEIGELKSRLEFIEKENAILSENSNEAELSSYIEQINKLKVTNRELDDLLKKEKEENLILITKNATLYSELEQVQTVKEDKLVSLVEQMEQSDQERTQLIESNSKLQSDFEEKNEELIIIRERLLKVTQEFETVQDNYNDVSQRYDREKRLQLDKIRKLERQIDEWEKKSQLSDTGNRRSETGPIPANQHQQQQLITQLKSGKENAEQQIAFLNNVIIERQSKFQELVAENEEMKEKMKALASNNNVSPTINEVESPAKRELPPRLYCDYCEVFDAHDTENCPITEDEKREQPNWPGQEMKKRPSMPPRVYCDICQIFDAHTTNECEFEETF